MRWGPRVWRQWRWPAESGESDGTSSLRSCLQMHQDLQQHVAAYCGSLHWLLSLLERDTPRYPGMLWSMATTQDVSAEPFTQLPTPTILSHSP